MTGDGLDFADRLRSVLPDRWFPNGRGPVIDGLLAGLGSSWALIWRLLAHARAQTRLATASDDWLDLIAADFFGSRCRRRAGESDPAFRARVQREMTRDRATRPALEAALLELTARSPSIFEPNRPADAGSWGSLGTPRTGLGYGVSGCWGNLQLPFQCFVTAYRPRGAGIATIAGWAAKSSPVGPGAYGSGSIEYASLSMVQDQVADAAICRAIADVLPTNAVAWVRILN